MCARGDLGWFDRVDAHVLSVLGAACSTARKPRRGLQARMTQLSAKQLGGSETLLGDEK